MVRKNALGQEWKKYLLVLHAHMYSILEVATFDNIKMITIMILLALNKKKLLFR